MFPTTDSDKKAIEKFSSTDNPKDIQSTRGIKNKNCLHPKVVSDVD